jgi:putative PIN family toxin of toxin-antitoxin system
MSPSRIVLDTGVLVSRILRPSSIPGRAVIKAAHEGTVLISEALVAELVDVLAHPKFRAYVDLDEARSFVQALGGIAQLVTVTAHFQACRDPDDDKLLALALSGDADLLITGDADLLVLDPFQGVRILSPRRFVGEGI